MLLIDAVYINNSGGLELLFTLISRLESLDIDVHYLLDSRGKKILYGKIVRGRYSFSDPSMLQRLFFYLHHRNTFSKILCFGNVPPPIKVNAIVYTYFHNINLLNIPFKYLSSKEGIIIKLKQIIIRLCSVNTDYWLVQTTNMQKNMQCMFDKPLTKIFLYPFWQSYDTSINEAFCRRDYVYVANYTPTKQHFLLIKVWEKLHELGFNLTLHLTLSNYPIDLEQELERALKNGVKIINHGSLEKSNIQRLYNCSKATIYPSLNESFGLGIIEALTAGCDVIGPDLPYIHSVCIPSVVFSSFEVDNVVNAIIDYERGCGQKSQLTITNNLSGLVDLLI